MTKNKIDQKGAPYNKAINLSDYQAETYINEWQNSNPVLL